jgi:hypothetical protein
MMIFLAADFVIMVVIVVIAMLLSIVTMSVRMPVMMVVAVPVIMLVRTIVGLERRCHLDAGKSMRGDQRLNLGPLLQPDAVV